ncbi:alpha/beta hydrolase [Chachezhania sediminis]|uniref:alpha/beta hydrolase n=1 Tax=Chachezhania sediminis TaxID=2599291 RepID=UPI00131B7616|nr:alpha/beta hydrolase [Chachezhania sediminis]
MSMELNRRTSPALELAGVLASHMGKAEVMPLRPQDAALFDGTEPFRFGPGDSRPAWSVGEGPLVVLVHGYGGRGSQMAPLAHRLAENGFRAVFFDAGGHGDAAPEQIGFSTFMSDTRDICAVLDRPVHGLIGHSAGGLGMMRSRALYGVTARRYGVIAAPFFPYPPLNTMRANGVTEEALEHVKFSLSLQFQTRWSDIAGGISFAPEDGADMLAIYDADDDRVQQSDGDAIAARWPGATVVKTAGLGHNRILKAEETLAAVTDFLCA